MYIKIDEGNHFGIIDIIGSLIEEHECVNEDWIKHKDLLRRQFTIMA
jgi:hypothetical protein